MTMVGAIFKILARREWARAEAAGVYGGSRVDEKDGFIHFSTAAQVRETASRHFAGQDDLVLLTVDPERCAPSLLRWEPSRRGALFPHLYGPLRLAAVVRVDPLPLAAGEHRFPDDVPTS